VIRRKLIQALISLVEGIRRVNLHLFDRQPPQIRIVRGLLLRYEYLYEAITFLLQEWRGLLELGSVSASVKKYPQSIGLDISHSVSLPMLSNISTIASRVIIFRPCTQLATGSTKSRSAPLPDA
jgi:hypothetical protein